MFIIAIYLTYRNFGGCMKDCSVCMPYVCR